MSLTNQIYADKKGRILTWGDVELMSLSELASRGVHVVDEDWC